MTGLRREVVASSQAGLAAFRSRPLPHSAAVTKRESSRATTGGSPRQCFCVCVHICVCTRKREQRPEADSGHLPQPRPR